MRVLDVFRKGFVRWGQEKGTLIGVCTTNKRIVLFSISFSVRYGNNFSAIRATFVRTVDIARYGDITRSVLRRLPRRGSRGVCVFVRRWL